MRVVRQSRLRFTQGTSDKVYEVDLVEVKPGAFTVHFRYGRFGANLRAGTKTSEPVAQPEANRVFEALVASKTKKGYLETHVPTTDASTEPKAPRPIDRAAQRQAILARLDAAVADPDADTDWPVERVIWRAGELRIQEATPALLALLPTGETLRRYCTVWALGRCGHAGTRRALRPLTQPTVESGHLRRMADEAVRALTPAAERPAYVAQVMARLPEPVQQTLTADDAEARTRLLDTFAAALRPDVLDALHPLYLLADEVETARQVILQFAHDVPAAAPFFFWLRHLYKAALFRGDGELFGVLAHRFATEPSGFTKLPNEGSYKQTDGQWIYTATRPDHDRGTGVWAVRRTGTRTERQKDGQWRRVYYLNQTRVRTSDGFSFVETDSLSEQDIHQLAGLGYTPKTRAYLERRAWRTLRRLGEADSPDYVPMAVGLLLAYSDADAVDPREVIQEWYEWSTRTTDRRTLRYEAFAPYLTFNHVLYAHSPRFQLKKSNHAWTLKEGVDLGAPAPDAREEAFPALWDARPEGLFHLLAESACAPVHTFAARALRANARFLDRLGPTEVRLLLRRPYPETVALGLDLARRLYDPAHPDPLLIHALLDAHLDEARAQAKRWIEAAPAVFLTDALFVTGLVVHPFEDVRRWVHSLLATPPLDLNTDALVGRVLAHFLALDAAEANVPIVEDATTTLLARFPEVVRRLSLDVLADLVRHPVPAVQAAGGRLLEAHATPAEALPGALIAALMTATEASVRATGLALFGRLPDTHLLDDPELLEALALSPLPDVRAHVRPTLRRLAARYPTLAEVLTEALLPYLYRTERTDGLHADLFAVLSDDAFASTRATFTRDRLWGLLHANHVPAQQLGALVLQDTDWSEALTIRQITRLASHELVAVRAEAQRLFTAQPERMRAHPIDALTLLDASWDDTRAFAFAFFRSAFDADTWTPDLLVHVADSVRPDVQAFGLELIARFFEAGDGATYLLKLSEHPSLTVQTFASDYLDTFATDRLDRLEALEHYFRVLLGQVNRGRLAKDRVLALLQREALKREEAAQFVAPLLAHHAATVAIGDKATLIEMMRDLQEAYPTLDVPLHRHALPAPAHASMPQPPETDAV